ncbi:Uncharacterised protein [Mycobacterium tuberculosis]|nr:Uncharacterised protein [Mycobacterium tuberculosis]
MFSGGNVADCVDVGIAGAQRCINQHTALAHRQPGLLGEFYVGLRAHSD